MRIQQCSCSKYIKRMFCKINVRRIILILNSIVHLWWNRNYFFYLKRNFLIYFLTHFNKISLTLANWIWIEFQKIFPSLIAKSTEFTNHENVCQLRICKLNIFCPTILAHLSLGLKWAFLIESRTPSAGVVVVEKHWTHRRFLRTYFSRTTEQISSEASLGRGIQFCWNEKSCLFKTAIKSNFNQT